jgi:DNA-binding GntR family transcriptional regulator
VLAVGTVRRGIDVLVKEGLVQTVPGRGTFVKRQRAVVSSCCGSQAT